jgi:membrane protease YdiL (CAAX protease family)
MSLLKIKKINIALILYFVITFIISWSCWWFSNVLTRSVIRLDCSWLLAQVGVFTPSIVGIFFSYFQTSEKSIKKLLEKISIYAVLIFIGIIVTFYNLSDLTSLPVWFGTIIIITALLIFMYFLFQRKILFTEQIKSDNKIWLFTLLFSSWIFYPLIFIILWLILSIAIGNLNVSLIETGIKSSMIIIPITIAFDFLYGGSVGEEIGWRGYALPSLLQNYNPLISSVVLGLILSLWHVPIDMIAGFGFKGLEGVLLRILTVCPMSIIITWFYLYFKMGIATSLLLHAGINIIPAFGFSNYEYVFGLLIVIQFIISIIIVYADTGFRQKITP